MKWIVVVGAGVLGISAFALRPVDSAENVRLRRSISGPVGERAEESRWRVLGTSEDASPRIQAFEEVRPEAPQVRCSEDEELQAIRGERLSTLQGELSLTREQRILVEEALRARDSEVAALHAEILASKVFWIAGHDRRAREIMAVSQQRIAAALSADQSRKFFDLLESGRLTEGVSFEVTPEITVIR